MVVILLYNEPDRGGIETEQSKIHLGVLGRLNKLPTCPHQTTKASFRGVELVYFKLQRRKKMLVCLAFRRVPERGRECTMKELSLIHI